jgi:hypothetical protein
MSLERKIQLRNEIQRTEKLLKELSEAEFDQPTDPAKLFAERYRLHEPLVGRPTGEDTPDARTSISRLIQEASVKMKRPPWVPSDGQLLDEAWLKRNCPSRVVGWLFLSSVLMASASVGVVTSNELLAYGPPTVFGPKPIMPSVGEAFAQAKAGNTEPALTYLVAASVVFGPGVAGFILARGPPCRAIKDKWGPLVQEVRQAEAKRIADHLSGMREYVWNLGDELALPSQPFTGAIPTDQPPSH